MELYNVVLFVHILAAIVVIGGSFAMEFGGARAKQARTVDSLLSWLRALAVGSKAIGMAAAVTLAAGIYLAFAGSWWGAGWLTVSLIIFLVSGALAGTVMDKSLARMVEIAEGFDDGPMTPDLGRQLVQPSMALLGPVMLGMDLALVFLMTNKPGYAGSLLVAAVTIGTGLAFGLRERRHALHPPAAQAAGESPAVDVAT